jgi:GT2 family glycosyltransferase
MDVSVIIVNYNTPQLTLQCLSSVFLHTTGISLEVIVVDNASTTCNPALFRERFPGIILVESRENLGFAGGNNLGLKHASGKYCLLLNSDAYLKDNAIYKTFQYLEDHPSAGVVSARLVFPDGHPQSAAQRFPSLKYGMTELLRLQKLMPRRAAGKWLLGSFFDHNENTTADWVWGAYFMFRKEVLERLPFRKLDDAYHMYCEDMQWCWDIRRLGYGIHFCADAEVVHLSGGSGGDRRKMMKESGALFLRRNYSPLHAGLIRLVNKWLQV